MIDLKDISFEKLSKIYSNYFSLKYLGNDISDKFACISLTCYLTYQLRKKKSGITCYDILSAVGKDFDPYLKESFLKPLAVVCEDFMYGCNTFPTFDLKPKDIPKQLKNILDNFVPF